MNLHDAAEAAVTAFRVYMANGDDASEHAMHVALELLETKLVLALAGLPKPGLLPACDCTIGAAELLRCTRPAGHTGEHSTT